MAYQKGGEMMTHREDTRKNQIVVPMPSDEKARIKEAAAKADRSMASYIRAVLREHMEQKDT